MVSLEILMLTTMTRHWKSSKVESIREMLGMNERKNGIYKDLEPTRMRGGSQGRKVMAALQFLV